MGIDLVIKKMIRNYGIEVNHKRKITTDLGDGNFEISYEVQEPKKGHFLQITPYDIAIDRYGTRIDADYIATFLPGTDVEEGDLLELDTYWYEVQNKIERKTRSTVDYIEVLLRRKR